MNEKIFTNGMIVRQRENAPDFVIAGLSIKPVEFVQWMRENIEKGSEWINIDLLVGKSGKPYACLNDFKPNQTPKQVQQRSHNPISKSEDNSGDSNSIDNFKDDIPF